MQDRWKLGIGVAGILTTFTFGASAGFLRQPAEEPGITTTTPSPPPPPSPAPSVTSLQPPAVHVVDVAHQEPRVASRPLDASDPWTPSPESVVASRAAKQKPAPLDSTDPWAATGPRLALPALPASRLDASDPWSAPDSRAAAPPSTPRNVVSHEALREAIQRAVDAGDFASAASLMQTLQSAR